MNKLSINNRAKRGVIPGNKKRRALKLIATAAMYAVSAASFATGTEGIEEGVNELVILLTGLGIGIVTIAIMWGGYKMAFAGARFQDISNIMIGAVMAGSAAALAAWLFT